MKVTKETTMGEMLELDGGIALILMQAGMHCVGCPSSIGESLEEACMCMVWMQTLFWQILTNI